MFPRSHNQQQSKMLQVLRKVAQGKNDDTKKSLSCLIQWCFLAAPFEGGQHDSPLIYLLDHNQLGELKLSWPLEERWRCEFFNDLSCDVKTNKRIFDGEVAWFAKAMRINFSFEIWCFDKTLIFFHPFFKAFLPHHFFYVKVLI